MRPPERAAQMCEVTAHLFALALARPPRALALRGRTAHMNEAEQRRACLGSCRFLFCTDTVVTSDLRRRS